MLHKYILLIRTELHQYFFFILFYASSFLYAFPFSPFFRVIGLGCIQSASTCTESIVMIDHCKSNSCNKFCIIYEMCCCENLKNSHRFRRYLQTWPTVTFLATHGGTGSCNDFLSAQKAATNYMSSVIGTTESMSSIWASKKDTIKMLLEPMNWKMVQTKSVMIQAGHKGEARKS